MKISLVLLILAGLIFSCAQKDVSNSDRTPSSDNESDPWTTWSRGKTKVGALLVLKKIREDLLLNNLHDPHLNYSSHKKITCDQAKAKYRSADGTCYDQKNPYVGAAGVAFGRNIAPEFIDEEAQNNLMTPNPSLVSKEFFTREEFKPVPFLNMLAASWIQFMNHDWLSHGKNETKRPIQVHSHNGEVEEVERTRESGINHDQYKEKFGKVSTNEVTHWWDGSQLYGSSYEQQKEVRSFSLGKMKLEKRNGKELLPKNTQLNIRSNIQNQGLEVTGFNENWWVGLSMLHHLFVKEHNSIAQMLFKNYVLKEKSSDGKWMWREGRAYKIVRRGKEEEQVPNYDNVKYFTSAELDEHIFQVARLINSAVMAKIHTIEWTPAILDNKDLRTAMYTNWYGIANPQTWSKLLKYIPGLNKTDWFSGTKTGYLVGGIVGDKRNDYGVPFSITEEFTSVYRLHSLLPENLNIKKFDDPNKEVKKISMMATRNEKSYAIMEEYDLKDLFYSFGTQLPGQLVLNNFPDFMQNLTIPGRGKMDLGMVDVLRDRERGVPRYNQFRRAIGLKPITSYRDFFFRDQKLDARQLEVISKFENVYGKDKNGNDNVEMIDLLVGTLAEEVRPEGFGFGETQFQIFILMASRRLMADRFFTDDYNKSTYTAAGMRWIDHKGYFHSVIKRHMPEIASKFKGLRTAFKPWRE